MAFRGEYLIIQHVGWEGREGLGGWALKELLRVICWGHKFESQDDWLSQKLSIQSKSELGSIGSY